MTRTTRPRYDARRDVASRSHVSARSSRPAPSGGAFTKVRIALIVGIVVVLAFIAYAVVIVRDESAIPMLALGMVVLGMICLAFAAIGGRGILSAGREGETGRAFRLAIAGGLSAMIGFGCFAAAVILLLVLRPPV